MGKFVTIKAGDPERGLEMFSTENDLRLERDFDGDPIKRKSSPAPFNFALSSEIWGKRVLKDGKPTGEIIIDEKWGEAIDEGYGLVRTQYHPTFNSFDYQYQKDNEMLLREDSDELFIEINQGTTAFESGTNIAKYLSKFHLHQYFSIKQNLFLQKINYREFFLHPKLWQIKFLDYLDR